MIDLHNDLLTVGLPFADIKKIASASNADEVVFAYWTSKLNCDALTVVSKAILSLSLAKQAKYFAIEDLWFYKKRDAEPLGALPLIYCGLTWNRDNALAGGALGSGELTKLGQSAIGALNKAGIAVDTAHLNRKSFYQVLDRADNVLNSHSNLCSICEHPRNLDNSQVSLLLEKGSVVGLTPVSDFLNKRTDAMAFADSIDVFVQKYGAKQLAIGTDFYGTTPLEGLKSYNDFNNITQRLKKIGYNETVLSDIFTNNAKNYILKIQENKNGKRLL